MSRRQINLGLKNCGADVAGDVQVEVVLPDRVHFHPAGVSGLILAELAGVDDLGDVIVRQLVLAFAFQKCSAALMTSTSSGFLHFLRTRMQTGMPVE